MKPLAAKQYLPIALLLLWALLAQGIYSGFLVYNQIYSVQQARIPFAFHNYSTIVQYVTPSYQNRGIQTGDEIIALDGERLDGIAQVSDVPFHLRHGDAIVLTLNRSVGGQTKTLDVRLILHDNSAAGLGWTFILGVFVALPLICLSVGFYVAFARPRDPLAWITLAMLASFTQLAGANISWVIWPPWRELLLVYHAVLSSTWPLWMLLFGLYFPVPFPFLKQRRWLLYVLALVPALLAALDAYGSLMEGHHVADIRWLAALNQKIATPLTFLFIAYVFGFFVCLALQRRRLTTADAIRRLRVMIAGCGIALAPTIPLVLGEVGVIPMMPPWLAVLCLLMLLNFPLTIGYVIVVQRAMDVRMVVRSGVQYALASTGIRVFQIALVIGVVRLMFYVQQHTAHRAQGYAIVAIGVVVITVLGRMGRRVRLWTDRRFFREAYNAERILTDLSSSVVGIRDTKRLLETVANRIADSLHVPCIAVLLENGGSYQPAYALGFRHGSPAVKFAEQSSTVRTLKQLRSPSKVYFDDPQSWVHGTSPPEQSALQSLGTQVLLPLSLDTKMLGIISLGSKRSEVPYTKADLQLLSAVAAQTGLAIENAYLSESIRKEIAQRERLDRELEIARDVQQRLFPQKLPHVHGLDFAGYCRPAQGVGGDYYDFIHLATGALGIAVGDVSGKGIAAALMMASLQASLRGQTIKPCETLAEMIHHINGLVYEASAANRYATFFYAQYEPVTRMLRYVNAGHNPPILRRKNGGDFEFIRLEEGGTVIGLFPDSPFKEAEIQLQAGDVLVAFTDGISEAMNSAEEEFDEERLLDAIRRCPDRSAAHISSYILEHVDAFTAGANQHDDMTLVTIRLI